LQKKEECKEKRKGKGKKITKGELIKKNPWEGPEAHTEHDNHGRTVVNMWSQWKSWLQISLLLHSVPGSGLKFLGLLWNTIIPR
jgi:hypothetical protein